MTTDFSKNFTPQGYLMNYRPGPKQGPLKHAVLQFRIELIGVQPQIWRKIQVPSYYNFWDLHVAIQDAFGWDDYHLHSFNIKGKRKRKEHLIGIPDFYRVDEDNSPDPGWEIPVTEHFNDLGVAALYTYDYGDRWEHSVLLEGYLLKEEGTNYPLCIGGARACPPEDCGGAPGYQEFLKAMSDPAHEQHWELKEWIGKEWDSEAFDCEKVHFDDPHQRWADALWG